MTRSLWCLLVVPVVVVVGAVLTFAVVGVVWLTEDVPVRYINAPFPVDGPIVAGERINPHVARCNGSGADVLVATSRRLRNLDSGDSVNLQPGSSPVAPGCSETRGDVVVPPGTAPGRYQIDYIVQMQGRWRAFAFPLSTQPFEVVP